MYIIILVTWVLLCIPMIFALIPDIQAGFRRGDAIGGTVVTTVMFIAYFWLNGVKDVIYPFAYRVTGMAGADAAAS